MQYSRIKQVEANLIRTEATIDYENGTGMELLQERRDLLSQQIRDVKRERAEFIRESLAYAQWSLELETWLQQQEVKFITVHLLCEYVKQEAELLEAGK